MIGVFEVALPVMIVAPWMVAQDLLSRRLLKRWAAESSFHLLMVERRWFFLGPFFHLPCPRGPVFRIIVESRNGRVKSGFVLANPSFQPPVDVQWD